MAQLNLPARALARLRLLIKLGVPYRTAAALADTVTVDDLSSSAKPPVVIDGGLIS